MKYLVIYYKEIRYGNPFAGYYTDYQLKQNSFETLEEAAKFALTNEGHVVKLVEFNITEN